MAAPFPRPNKITRALGSSIAVAALLMSTPADGVAQRSLEGYWDFVVMSESGDPQVRLTVGLAMTQDGRLRGTPGGAGPSVMTGSMRGPAVEFSWEADFEGTPVDFRFSGTTSEDGMSGSVELDFGDRGGITLSKWIATRAEPVASSTEEDVFEFATPPYLSFNNSRNRKRPMPSTMTS
jgi:hypothetical protein